MLLERHRTEKPGMAGANETRDFDSRALGHKIIAFAHPNREQQGAEWHLYRAEEAGEFGQKLN